MDKKVIWLSRRDCLGYKYTICSKCEISVTVNGKLIDLRCAKYCPNCGARMEKKR